MLSLATLTPIDQLPGMLWPALKQTLEMVGVTMLIVVALDTPLGTVLHNTRPGGLFPHRRVNAVIGWITNLGRSLPFLVLMAAIIPFTRLITGTTIGIWAAVVPMTIAGTPFFARLVENALREVPREVTDVARASGGSTMQIILHAQLSEAMPGLAAGLTFNSVGMLEYSAIAGAIGARRYRLSRRRLRLPALRHQRDDRLDHRPRRPRPGDPAARRLRRTPPEARLTPTRGVGPPPLPTPGETTPP